MYKARYTRGKAEDRKEPQGTEKLWFFSHFNINLKQVTFMSKQVLIVVDMQNDFIDGVLGTEQAQAIVQNVVDKVKSFNGEIVFTRDTHFENYIETNEGKNLPVPHCIKGSNGWQICSKLESFVTENTAVFDKITFGSVELAEYLKSITELEEVTLVGLCTDICVISNALLIKANLPEIVISVDEKCCAGVTPQSHNNAINAMKMCHINIINEQ